MEVLLRNAGMGRPTHYKPEYAEISLLLRSRGYTDRDIAAVLRVAASTLCGWKQAHPEFLNALRSAKSRDFHC